MCVHCPRAPHASERPRKCDKSATNIHESTLKARSSKQHGFGSWLMMLNMFVVAHCALRLWFGCAATAAAAHLWVAALRRCGAIECGVIKCGSTHETVKRLIKRYLSSSACLLRPAAARGTAWSSLESNVGDLDILLSHTKVCCCCFTLRAGSRRIRKGQRSDHRSYCYALQNEYTVRSTYVRVCTVVQDSYRSLVTKQTVLTGARLLVAECHYSYEYCRHACSWLLTLARTRSSLPPFSPLPTLTSHGLSSCECRNLPMSTVCTVCMRSFNRFVPSSITAVQQ